MTLKEIEKKFIVENFYNGSERDLNRFNIKSKTEEGMRYAGGKYLCTINRNDKKFFVDGCVPTDNLDVLEKQINDHVSSLPYDSEYYYPATMISAGILPKQQRKIYETLTSSPQTTREISKKLKLSTKQVSAQLISIHKNTLLISFKLKNKRSKLWYKNE